MASRRRNTKIVATLGPSCADRATQRAMIEAGVDVARLNASHGDRAFFTEMVAGFRAVAAELGREVSILLDLRGPKIRVGELPDEGVDLQAGAELVVTTEAGPGTATRIPCTYPGLPADVEPGDRLLLDDGLLSLRVEEVASDTEIRCTVLIGGRLRSNKGINLPGVHVSAPSLSDKDKEDLAWALENDVDYVALSFVRSAVDVRHLKRRIRESGREVPIIAKIEKREAVESMEEIIAESDGIMVARGDLGIEIGDLSVEMPL